MLLLQIVYPDGQVVRFPAGGPMEAELTQLLSEKIKARVQANILNKPVGLFRTHSQVAQAVAQGIDEGFAQGIADALSAFKKSTTKGFV